MLIVISVFVDELEKTPKCVIECSLAADIAVSYIVDFRGWCRNMDLRIDVCDKGLVMDSRADLNDAVETIINRTAPVEPISLKIEEDLV